MLWKRKGDLALLQLDSPLFSLESSSMWEGSVSYFRGGLQVWDVINGFDSNFLMYILDFFFFFSSSLLISSLPVRHQCTTSCLFEFENPFWCFHFTPSIMLPTRLPVLFPYFWSFCSYQKKMYNFVVVSFENNLQNIYLFSKCICFLPYIVGTFEVGPVSFSFPSSLHPLKRDDPFWCHLLVSVGGLSFVL